MRQSPEPYGHSLAVLRQRRLYAIIVSCGSSLLLKVRGRVVRGTLGGKAIAHNGGRRIMSYNPAAFVQWLREHEPEPYGLAGVGSEVEDLTKPGINDLTERMRASHQRYVLKAHRLLFQTARSRPNSGT